MSWLPNNDVSWERATEKLDHPLNGLCKPNGYKVFGDKIHTHLYANTYADKKNKKKEYLNSISNTNEEDETT